MALSPKQRSARYRKKHPERSRELVRDSLRRTRAAAREANSRISTIWPDLPADPAGAAAEWARATLIVPPGHPKAGEPFELPDYLVNFFRDALAPDTQESLLCIARKNSKSGAVAVLLLAHLVGPLMREGWRCGVASLSREKASELKMQVEAIAKASGLKGIQFWRRSSPAITAPGGSVDILSADRNAAAAGGWDLSVCDEIGLMHEKHRELVNSLRSSVSARGGRFMALSVWGDGPFCGEIVQRRDAPGVAVHLHQPASEDCALDDEAAWHAANPGLAAGIKQRSYMVSESRRVLATPSDQASFRALDLNQPGSPSREMVCSPSDWAACVVPAGKLPARSGPCYIGFDAGGSSSMTAAAAYWPETKRLEIYAAFPATPGLADRGQADGVGGVGGIYQEAHERGELMLFDGRVTPVGAFLLHLAASLEGVEVAGAASDQYRRAEVQQALEAEALEWPWSWRRMGAGPQGSSDVMAFQRAILRGEFRTRPSLLMPLALKSTVLRRDGNGNPALERGNTGRIDVLSACVLAAGLASASSGDEGLVVSGRIV